MKCEKYGCERDGRWLVILDTEDVSVVWQACKEHAYGYYVWALDETRRQGADWGSVHVEFLDQLQ